MLIRFYGNATVSLHSGSTCLLIDPWFAGEPWFRPNPFMPEFPAGLRPDLLLVTHGHGDHLGDAIALSVRLGVPIHAPRELAVYCARKGASASGGQPGGTSQFPWGRVKLVPAVHASSAGPDYENVGFATGIVIELEGKVVYHAGDTALFGDMELIGSSVPIDVALLPIGDYFTMGPEDACIAVQLLRPRIVVPIHYGTFPQMTGDPSRFKEMVGNRTAAQCVILNPGEAFELT